MAMARAFQQIPHLSNNYVEEEKREDRERRIGEEGRRGQGRDEGRI